MDLSILSKLLNSVNSVNAFRENATVPIISFGNVGFFRRQQNISCFPMSSGDNIEGPDEVSLPGTSASYQILVPYLSEVFKVSGIKINFTNN